MSEDVKALIVEAGDIADYADRQQFYGASRVIRELVAALEAAQQAPAVDREALVNLLERVKLPTQGGAYAEKGYADDFNDGVSAAIDAVESASGILLDAAEFEERGLEKAARISERIADDAEVRRNDPLANGVYWDGFSRGTWAVKRGVTFRAQQVREGKA